MHQGHPFFLNAAFIRESCKLLDFPQPISARLIEAANSVADDSCLLTQFIENQQRLLQTPKQPLQSWPRSTLTSRQCAGLLNLLLWLSGILQMEMLYAERAIPQHVMTDTLSDVLLHIRKYYEKHGAWGIDSGSLNWLAYHVRGDLYRLGRLQFMPCKFPAEFFVFRNRSQGTVVMLATKGIGFRQDGQINGAGGVTDTKGVWKSKFYRDSNGIYGNPIDPGTGSALPTMLALKRQEWAEVLQPGDWCLDVHIPDGEALNIEACRETFREARQFFSRHFPEREFKGFICISWLCDAQLVKWLPANSNIVRWLREFYLFPVASDAWSIVRSVFGLDIPYGWQGNLDLTELPRHTSLQRAITSHIECGGHWRKAGALLLSEDLDKFATQFYRCYSVSKEEYL